MGFVGTRRIGGWRFRVAALALCVGLVVPGHALGAAPAALGAAAGIEPVPAAGAPTRKPAAAGDWIVVLDPGALSSTDRGGVLRLDTGAGRAAARGRALSTGRAIDRLSSIGGFQVGTRYAWALQGFSARLTAGQVSALRGDPAVARVVPDTEVQIAADSWPPGVRRIHGGTAGSVAGPDVDADVAVIDTGIGPVGGPVGSDAELDIAGGVDCHAGGAGNDAGSFADGHGHGTHVAGTIGARDNGVGVVGVAPGARLWAVRVFDASGRGSTSGVICGIDWVARWVVQHPGRPMVANMSLRGYDDYHGPTGCDASGRDTRDPEHQAICTATTAGVVFVVAAGNERDDTDDYIPARYDEVITVAAISDFDGLPGSHGSSAAVSGCTLPSGPEKDDSFARYSNFGTAVDIVAPGTCIRSLAPGAGSTVRTAVMSGTSMATPHVTGAVARYLASHPDADFDQVRRQVVASGSLDWATTSDPDRDAHPGRPLLRLVDTSALTSDTPDIAVWPGAATIGIGGDTDRVTIDFELQRIGGLAGAVDMSLDGLPGGITVHDPGTLRGITGLRGSVRLDVTDGAISGDHALRLTATAAGARSSGPVTLRIDRAAPRIGSPWPRVTLRTGTYDGSAPVRLAWTVSDDASGVANTELQRKSTTWKRVASGTGLSAATTSLTKSATTSFRIRATDRAGNVGTSSVLTSHLQVRDSASSHVHWTGSWRTVPQTSATGRSVRMSRAPKASATLAFRGRGVGIVAPRGPGLGKLDIRIDGRLVGIVDLAASSTQPRRIVFVSGPLASGDHVISITARKAGAQLDAILVLG